MSQSLGPTSSARDESNIEEMRPVLIASAHDVRYLTALLRGVNFANRATVTITQYGFNVVVEEARTIMATAFVRNHVFQEYQYFPEKDVDNQSSQNSDIDPSEAFSQFEIQLNTLLECLNIFGTAGQGSLSSHSKGGAKRWRNDDDGGDGDDDGPRNRRGRGVNQQSNHIDHYFSDTKRGTGMRLTYNGAGHPLILVLAEDSTGPTAKCEITTFDSEPHLELSLPPENTHFKVILNSSWLRDALSELDPSCEKLTFIGNPPVQNPRGARAPSKPLFRIQAAGTFGSTEMDYPNDRDVIETFLCEHPVSFTYRFNHISKTLRALQNSTKTSLRIDGEGLLSLQFIIPFPKVGGTGHTDEFLEFLCLPLDDDV
ncbi:hypothetical protein JAAARDRAFT_205648 [Jaapia argillacea MUCL 33604]|uniref:Rad1-domain-containing protein n=1 Tax=Jaapia argillacea MUCL 33604 TaxID=933084 RepID=A0A067QAL3_9AGAM|nr:hypothetical protein JAAARDRAFT_205648 [Jaapia argillacea MUCL 33604]